MREEKRERGRERERKRERLCWVVRGSKRRKRDRLCWRVLLTKSFMDMSTNYQN